MASAKRKNDFLDTHDSDSSDGEAGYDSEELAESRAAQVSRTSKRRRVSRSASPESNAEDSHAEEEEKDVNSDTSKPNDDGRLSPTAPPSKNPSSIKPKPLTTKSLTRTNTAAKRTGVIYLSRIPPFMKPSTLRSLLSHHGALGRIFLAPESPASHHSRVRSGGNKKKAYTDGWVEFLSKADAKRVAETLNAQIIGGRKGGWYHDDLWNIKYLKGFKWANLTEQIANENAEREARMRLEIGRQRREEKVFVRGVQRAKVERRREEKRKRRVERGKVVVDVGGNKGDGGANEVQELPVLESKRSGGGKKNMGFRQTKVLRKGQDTSGERGRESVRDVLAKIF
ncbi:MAG: RNA-binding ATPase activator esf2 [Vezdaea acicularis]|nr:MAG: RNA-binding ATPase activator esf2 [Vezdaea acicularis]